jgi:hypothetical protein
MHKYRAMSVATLIDLFTKGTSIWDKANARVELTIRVRKWRDDTGYVPRSERDLPELVIFGLCTYPNPEREEWLIENLAQYRD